MKLARGLEYGVNTGVIKIDINPVLVHIGPVAIHWYGVMYVIGIGIAILIALPYAEARGISRDTVLELFFPLVLAGLVGGRLYYVVQSNFGYYLAHPWNIPATWEGGMAFYGAIFAAFLMVLYLSWRRRLPFWAIMDAGAVFAPIGQAFGRIGNIINGDIIGRPSNCAWCTQYVNVNSFAPRHDVAYQPAAAYELLISLAIFAVVWWLRCRMPRSGMLFALYLLLYSVSQFLIFFVRTQPIVLLGLQQAQVTSIITGVVAVALFAYLWRIGAPMTSSEPAMSRQDSTSPSEAAGTG